MNKEVNDLLDEVDDKLRGWEDYFHGDQGEDVTRLRFLIDKIKQLLYT